MKKITFIALFLISVCVVSAQDFASTFLNKHADKDLEVVSIGKQMLSMVSGMSANDQELKEAIQGLESIKIITSDVKECAQKSFKNAYAMLTKKSAGFEEVMSVKEENEETYIMTREESGVVKDLVFISSDSGSFNMICLSGVINMATLAKLSAGMKLDKLKKLDTVKEQSKRQ